MLTTTKPNRCKHCKKRMPEEQARHVLHKECQDPWIAAQLVKQKLKAVAKKRIDARVDRSLRRQRREAIKTIPERIKEAQTAFNAYIRARDADKPCICCRQPLSAGDVGGKFDCGQLVDHSARRNRQDRATAGRGRF